jgi:hypothetical protein
MADSSSEYEEDDSDVSSDEERAQWELFEHLHCGEQVSFDQDEEIGVLDPSPMPTPAEAEAIEESEEGESQEGLLVDPWAADSSGEEEEEAAQTLTDLRRLGRGH